MCAKIEPMEKCMTAATNFNQFFYEIELAYEYNCICSYVENQMESATKHGVCKSSDVFYQPNTITKTYLQGKLDNYAQQRNIFFLKIKNALKDTAVLDELENIKKQTTDCFNKYYKTNKTFEEICEEDGMTNDSKFNQDLQLYRQEKSSEEFNNLVEMFADCRKAWQSCDNVIIARDILQALEDEIDSYGCKAYYGGQSKVDDVYKLNCETIKDLNKYAKGMYKSQQKLVNKCAERLKKSAVPKNADPLVAKHKELVEVLNVCGALCAFVYILNKRRIAATTANVKKIDLLKARLIDMFMGVNPLKKFKPTDFVYVHKIELDELINTLLYFEDTDDIINSIKNETGYDFEIEEVPTI